MSSNHFYHQKLQSIVTEMFQANGQVDTISKLSKLNDEMNQYLSKKHAVKHFNNLTQALKEGRQDIALRHRFRLDKITQLTANDRPAKKNQRVAIVRTEHGWHDGSWSGTVVNAYQNGDTWQYNVRVENTDGEDLPSSEQFFVDVAHTRDLSF